jgi:hypothetical protein
VLVYEVRVRPQLTPAVLPPGDAELEMRAAEEPLKSDLDVKGLKAQVLDRIEELEEREREREELFAELVPRWRREDAELLVAVS